jgi:hypothetical protein
MARNVVSYCGTGMIRYPYLMIRYPYLSFYKVTLANGSKCCVLLWKWDDSLPIP